MKKEIIIKKAFQCTDAEDWKYLDSHFLSKDYFSKIVYADTASKARYKTILETDCYELKFKDVRVRGSFQNDLLLNEPHVLHIQINKSQYSKIAHAIGHDFKEDPYRNRYCIDNDPEWDDLVGKGLAESGHAIGQKYYWLTDLGLTVILSMNPIPRYVKNISTIPHVEQT